MARIKRAVHAHKKRRKVLERAKGYKGARSRRFRTANEQVMHAMQDSYRDRRARKGDFRRLWIARINAAARQHDMSYSRFIAGLKAAEIEVDRKMLAEMAVSDADAFSELVKTAKAALPVAAVPKPAPAPKVEATPASAPKTEPKVAPEPEAAPEPAITPEPEGADEAAPVAEAPEPAPAELDQETAAAQLTERFATLADAEGDDLTEIKGVGPVLAGMLDELNVKTFEQIAAFDASDVALVTAALTKFKDRITKDDWVSQAAELTAGKSGG